MARERPAKQGLAGQNARDAKGRFAKGASGNPRGRRPAEMATVEKLRAALAEELPGILKTVVAAAKDGDVAACRLILDRILPPLKAAEAPVVVEEIGGGSRSSQGEAILLAMADGVLSPSQAAQLIGALAAQAKIVEVDELERRLTKLEESIGRDNGTH